MDENSPHNSSSARTAPGSLGIVETCLYVQDLDQAEDFYAGVLGLKILSRQDGRHLFFRCGTQMLLLFLPVASEQENAGVPPHGARGPGHVAFSASSDEFDRWKAHLESCQVGIEQVVVWPQGGRSVYFRDPSGNSLEITSPSIWGIPE